MRCPNCFQHVPKAKKHTSKPAVRTVDIVFTGSVVTVDGESDGWNYIDIVGLLCEAKAKVKIKAFNKAGYGLTGLSQVK